ncbi:MAG: hypothetical protein L0177_17630 [Chloroflexi bacterium]|nr:hypothetical protein [Chloroflexota bacterium]
MAKIIVLTAMMLFVSALGCTGASLSKVASQADASLQPALELVLDTNLRLTGKVEAFPGRSGNGSVSLIYSADGELGQGTELIDSLVSVVELLGATVINTQEIGDDVEIGFEGLSLGGRSATGEIRASRREIRVGIDLES